MRVRIDYARQDQHAGRVDEVAGAGLRRDALANFEHFAIADEDVGFTLGIGGDPGSASGQHRLITSPPATRPSPLIWRLGFPPARPVPPLPSRPAFVERGLYGGAPR